MKKLLTSVFIIGLFISHAFAQHNRNDLYTDAAKYNNYIVDRQKAIVKSIQDMSAEISVDRSVALIMLKTSEQMALRLAKEVAELAAFNSNIAFRDQAAAMFRYYGTSYSAQFKNIIVIGGNKNLTTVERQSLKQKGIDLDKEEADINALFKAAQRRFSYENNLRLE